jgi:hypothetical protein
VEPQTEPLPEVVGPIRLPPEVVEALVGYGLQTAPGQALWRGYLLGAGLPKGDGGIEVRGAVYLPKPAPDGRG